jgi:poly-gamma-glutamate synthesis protein (capsule biosynthesis protein)
MSRTNASRLVCAVLGLFVLGVGAFGWASWFMAARPHFDPLPPRIAVRTSGDARVVRLVFGGDFAPVDAAMSIIRQAGYRYPYLGTDALIRGADIAFLNLEAPVTESTLPVGFWKKYMYRVEPAAAETWRWLGLDIVSIANNHVLDYRQKGLLDTLAALDQAGIEHVGAGRDAAAARRPVVFEIGETRIGFLGYLENQASFCLYEGLFASQHGPGCAKLTRQDVAEDVRRLRAQVDVLIVSVHWGENYSGITAGQREYARVLLDLGVDAVIGHHPHNEQAMLVRGRSIVFYSLGNYAWGAPGHDDLRIGLLARLLVEPRSGTRGARVVGAEVFPIVTQNRLVQYRPRRLTRSEHAWLEPFVSASRDAGVRCTVLDDEEGPWVRVDMDAE